MNSLIRDSPASLVLSARLVARDGKYTPACVIVSSAGASLPTLLILQKQAAVPFWASAA